MIGKWIRFSVRVIHTPTGLSATIDASSNVRTERQAHVKALTLLRSRVWAAQNGFARSDAEVGSYELPDGEQCPHEMSEYRKSPTNCTT
jgi:hypothetical protein